MKTLKIYAIVLFFLSLFIVAFGLMNVQQDIKPENLKREYVYPRSKFVRVFNQDVHYTDDGYGPTLVLIHGVGESLHAWYDTLGELSRSFRVISITLPGHGLTGPAPRGDYSITSYTAFLEAFLRKLGIQQAHLAGSSLGGYIAWYYAQQWPSKVDKLILISSGGFPTSYRLPMFYLAEIPHLNKLIQFVTPKIFVSLTLKLSYMPHSRLVTEDLVSRYYHLNHRSGNREALVSIYRTLNAADPTPLGRVKSPTLVIWGAEDRVIPPKFAHKFEQVLPGARLIIYKGIGHSVVGSAPKDVVSDFRKFLAPELFK